MRNFRKAIAATLSFVLCVSLLAEAIIWPYFHGTSYSYQDATVRDALAGSIDTLISGASHAASDFDTLALDEALGTNSYNIGGSLMSIGGRKTLFDKELNRNPVKTLILELSFNTLTRDRATEGVEGDLYVLGRMSTPAERLHYFFTAFSDSEYLRVATDTLDRGIHAWRSSYMGVASNLRPENKGFVPQDTIDKSMSVEEFAENHHIYSVNENMNLKSESIIRYMIEEAQSRGIEVIFVTTPLSDRALSRYDNFEEIRQWYLGYAQEYHCAFIDFNLYRQRNELLPDASSFFDDFHLSGEGAAIFSKEISHLIQALRAGEDISDQFYGSYAEVDALLCSTYE